MCPFGIPTLPPLRRRRHPARITGKPVADVEVVELLGPKHAGKGLALHQPPLRIGDTTLQGGIERIGFVDPLCHDHIEITERRCLLARPP